MNILIICHDDKMSGANLSLHNLLTQRKAEDNIIVAITNNNNKTIDVFKKIGIKCCVLKHVLLIKKNNSTITYSFKNMVRKIYKIIFFKHDINKACNFLKHIDFIPDIIISNSFCDVFGYYISKKMCVPHVFYVREFMEDDHQISHIDENIDRICKNSYAIFISTSIEKAYRKKYHFKDTMKVYNYIKPPKFVDNKKKNKRIRLCMVGTLSYGKGQLFLLKALKLLEDDFYADRYELNMAGEGPIKKEIQSYVNKNIKSKITLHGQIDDIYSFYSKNDVLVICSNKEALGRVVVEGFYCRKIIIGPDAGETKILLKNRGLLYKAGNIDSLAAAIKKTIDNYDNLTINVDDNYNFAIKNFACNKYNDILDCLYKWINYDSNENVYKKNS